MLYKNKIISALYECDSDNDIGSMEVHGSVVTHLLSQVKIGMDLTKVLFLSLSHLIKFVL